MRVDLTTLSNPTSWLIASDPREVPIAACASRPVLKLPFWLFLGQRLPAVWVFSPRAAPVYSTRQRARLVPGGHLAAPCELTLPFASVLSRLPLAVKQELAPSVAAQTAKSHLLSRHRRIVGNKAKGSNQILVVLYRKRQLHDAACVSSEFMVACPTMMLPLALTALTR